MKSSLIGWKPIGNDHNIASARLRCFEPLEQLQREGMNVEIFQPQKKEQYDTIIFQKCSDIGDVQLAAATQKRGGRVIYDLCDNLFYFKPGETRFAERAERTRQLAGYADVITVSTPTLQSVIEKETGKTAIIVPDPVAIPKRWNYWQFHAYWGALRHQISKFQKSRPLEVIWYGNSLIAAAEGGLRDLLKITPTLERLHQEIPLRLTVISNGHDIFKSEIASLQFPSRYIEWKSYAQFYSIAPYHDICVIPFSRNPVTECKSNNRLSLSLHMGVAVVADGIPSYCEFAPYCQLDNWEKGLHAYATSPKLRLQHVQAGRAYIDQHYTLQCITKQWQTLLKQD